MMKMYFMRFYRHCTVHNIKTLPNGESNPKYIDLCGEDKPISGQKFVCLSFISSEKVVNKESNLFLINS